MENLSFEELSALIVFHAKPTAFSGLGISPTSIDRIAEAVAAYKKLRCEIKANKETTDAQ